MAGKSAGRRGSRWRNLVANQRIKGLPCYIDGQPIDYSLQWPHPDSFSVDHIKSWIAHPELREDPANLATAHLRCNQAKGKGDAPVSLGIQSEQW